MNPIPTIRKPFVASIELPGSKSIALRQLAMAALTHGHSTISGVPECDDILAMLDCLRALGVQIDYDGRTVSAVGPMDLHGDVALNLRMSGASTRLVLALAALRHGTTKLDGHASLRARPHAPLLEVLRAHGCQVEDANGCLPATIRGPFEAPPSLTIDGSISSQYITALLTSAPWFMREDTQQIIIAGDLVSKPYLDITLNEMAKRGISATWLDERTFQVNSGGYASGEFEVEGDATAASYFIALATLHGGQVTLENLGERSKQGDYAFLNIAEQLGASVERQAHSTVITGPTQLTPLAEVDMESMPDAALTLIAMAPLLPTGARITGLSTLKHKECDRLVCSSTELSKLGVKHSVDDQSITIETADAQALQAIELNTYDDHRMAMAFSTLASRVGNMRVDDLQVVAKTYPNYWQDYRKLIA
ncbi:MAG: 3-phosphoshikimate 1-carboxyvinyltransferase [Pseudomonadota bacterium]